MLRTIDSPNTVQLTQPNTTETVHKMDSEGDATFKACNLDDMFEQLEELNLPQDGAKQNSHIQKMSKYLKPKVINSN